MAKTPPERRIRKTLAQKLLRDGFTEMPSYPTASYLLEAFAHNNGFLDTTKTGHKLKTYGSLRNFSGWREKLQTLGYLIIPNQKATKSKFYFPGERIRTDVKNYLTETAKQGNKEFTKLKKHTKSLELELKNIKSALAEIGITEIDINFAEQFKDAIHTQIAIALEEAREENGQAEGINQNRSQKGHP